MTVADAQPDLEHIDRSDRAFIGHPKGLGFLAFTQGFVPKSEPKMGLRQVRIESDRFHERQHRLGVLVVAVEFLAFFQLLAGSSALPGQIVGHISGSGTIIRALLFTASATRYKYRQTDGAD